MLHDISFPIEIRLSLEGYIIYIVIGISLIPSCIYSRVAVSCKFDLGAIKAVPERPIIGTVSLLAKERAARQTNTLVGPPLRVASV